MFVLLTSLIIVCSFLTVRGSSDQKRYKVLETDTNGNLYLYNNALLCKNEIIKRLTAGNYRMVESKPTLGLSKEFPGLNCLDLKLKVPLAASGVYWIDPDGGSHSNAFQAFCDQQTDGGGWTLVWSYTFTAYSSFTSSTNAVTPRPSWTASSANTRVSITVPLSETHYEAMNFALWRTIGRQILIKSNINNWIVCKEGSGSLVRISSGSFTCKLVKQVSQQCAGVVPNRISFTSYGPYMYLYSNGHYYNFNAYTGSGWPSHDPCGATSSNHLKGVVNPHGNIFVR